MYCPLNEPENTACECSRCCRLYNIAVAFLAALLLFTLGLIFGVSFTSALIDFTATLIAAAVILSIILIVTLLTRGCCRNNT